MKKFMMLALASAMAFGMSVCAFAVDHPLDEGVLTGRRINPGETIEFCTPLSSATTVCSYSWAGGSVVGPGIDYDNDASIEYVVLDPTDPALAVLGIPVEAAGYWEVQSDDISSDLGSGSSYRNNMSFVWVAALPPAASETSYTEQEQDFWHDDVLTKALQTKVDAKTGEKTYTAKIADCYDRVPVGVVDTLRTKQDLTVIFEYKGEEITLDLSKLPKSEANRAFYPMEYFIEIVGK